MGASHLNDSLVDPGKREEMRRWLNDFHFNPQLLASQAMLGNAASSILRGPMRLSLESPSVPDDDTMTLRSSVWGFCGDEVIDHGEAHLEPSDDVCMESRLEIILQDEGVYEHATDLTHVYEMPDDTEGNGCEHQMLPTEDMMTASDPDGFVENQQGGEDPAVEALHVDDGLSKSTAQDGMETGMIMASLMLIRNVKRHLHVRMMQGTATRTLAMSMPCKNIMMTKRALQMLSQMKATLMVTSSTNSPTLRTSGMRLWMRLWVVPLTNRLQTRRHCLQMLLKKQSNRTSRNHRRVASTRSADGVCCSSLDLKVNLHVSIADPGCQRCTGRLLGRS